MVGFVLGCVTWATVHERFFPPAKPAVPTPEQTATTQPTPTPRPNASAKTPALSLEVIDGLFNQYSNKAIWENDITEAAFWNPAESKYTDLMEIMRGNGGNFYFRPIPQLTRPLADYDVDARWPVRFTEPEALRAKRWEIIPALFRQPPPKLNP